MPAERPREHAPPVAAARRRRLRADRARQLADLLRHQILTGGFPGGVLPLEDALGQDYGQCAGRSARGCPQGGGLGPVAPGGAGTGRSGGPGLGSLRPGRGCPRVRGQGDDVASTPAAGLPHPAPSRNRGLRPRPPPGLRPEPRSSIAGGAGITHHRPGTCTPTGAGPGAAAPGFGKGQHPQRGPAPARTPSRCPCRGAGSRRRSSLSSERDKVGDTSAPMRTPSRCPYPAGAKGQSPRPGKGDAADTTAPARTPPRQPYRREAAPPPVREGAAQGTPPPLPGHRRNVPTGTGSRGAAPGSGRGEAGDAPAPARTPPQCPHRGGVQGRSPWFGKGRGGEWLRPGAGTVLVSGPAGGQGGLSPLGSDGWGASGRRLPPGSRGPGNTAGPRPGPA